MFRHRYLLSLLTLAAVLIWAVPQSQAQNVRARDEAMRSAATEAVPDLEATAPRAVIAPQLPGQNALQGKKRSTQPQREAAAARAKAAREAKAAGVTGRSTGAFGTMAVGGGGGAVPVPTQGGVPDIFGIYSNWANSPRNIRKFVDALPGLTSAGANALGQYIPVAKPDTVTYPGSDYYELSLVQYTEKMHSDLPVTTLRGYVQTNNGTNTTVCGATCTVADNTLAPDPVHYLGPVIVATKDRAVRVKFTNNLPTGALGKLFLPVDTTVMGSGPGPNSGWTGIQPADLICASGPDQPTPPACFTENRATLHLHGGKTPWISDGTPHQWITPATENTVYKSGVSKYDVPDMPAPGAGSQTFYWSNQQSARLMFYHDHASGITRLNVYAGEAAGYLITDDAEKAMQASGAIPPFADTIPLVIQDKTFVDAPNILATDPTWNSGTGALVGSAKTPKAGDLWWPHVYVPAQNPYDMSGVNPWGRWAYGPWFWPPTQDIRFPEVPNIYYDPTCDPFVATYCEPPFTPGTPNTSWGAEAFLDTPVVNGTVYPTLTLSPKAYRLRILNAAHDRFWNLQLYRADPAISVGTAGLTEVRMVPATNPLPAGYPADWPTDGRAGGAPDPALMGPSFLQIGTESGFLPKPVVVPNQPITWNMDPTTFNFGNVDLHGLLLGPAERADVIVDFSTFAGQTLILYNDAPAAFPALDPRLDYYTGAPDMRDTGGVASPVAGFGPNTRTIMQIKVTGPGAPTPFVRTALDTAFNTLFATAQDPIIVGQSAYNGVYASNPTFPYFAPAPARAGTFNGVAKIQDTTLYFETAAGLNTSLPMRPKAIHDEMGAAYDEYGRMSAKLGLELPVTTNLNQTFWTLNYVDPTTETIVNNLTPGSVVPGDGTQIWKITHNGVDTHPVHFHIFDAQLVNRVGWDGVIRLPEATERGWKDTIRISPLEDTIVAVRPSAPRLPFGVPDSIRPLNPALPIGATDGFTNIDVNGQPLSPVTTNVLTNFGWEYVWHCHILSHEEADMMRPIRLNVAVTGPAAPVLSRSGTTLPATLTWTDPTPATPANLGNPRNEIGFWIQRANVTTSGTVGTYSQIGTTPVPANTTTFTDTTASQTGRYSYRVQIFNAVGTALSNAILVEPGTTAPPTAPSNLNAAPASPAGVLLTWNDNSNNETGFLIQRAPDNTFASVTPFNVGAGVISYPDTTAAVGITYFYRVIALNGTVQSAPSNIVSITLAAAGAPSNLAATILSGPGVRLNWTVNSTTQTGFQIQSATNATFTGGSLQTFNVAGNLTTWQQNVNQGTYYYRIRATFANPTPPSAWSNTAVAGPPAAPTGLIATQASGATNVILTWTDNATNESSFTVQRSSPGGAAPYTTISTRPSRAGTGSVTYSVPRSSFTPGQTYTFQVQATNALGNSTYVVSASIVTH